jgi:hypothetical protein
MQVKLENVEVQREEQDLEEILKLEIVEVCK